MLGLLTLCWLAIPLTSECSGLSEHSHGILLKHFLDLDSSITLARGNISDNVSLGNFGKLGWSSPFAPWSFDFDPFGNVTDRRAADVQSLRYFTV